MHLNIKKTCTLLFSVILFSAADAQVIITQYYEGAGTNKWIELTNVGATTINLGLPQLRLGIWTVGGTTGNIAFTGAPGSTMDLTGSMSPGQTILIGRSDNGTEVPYLTAASASQVNSNVIAFNGNDGIALLDGSNAILDQFGLGINAADISYVRNTNVIAQSATYDPAEWVMTDRAVVQAAGPSDPNRLGFHIAGSTASCNEPAAQPSSIGFSSTPTSVTGTFTASAPAVDAYLVVRSTSPTLSANPADAVTYSSGQALGGGTVVIITSATSFTDVNLNAASTYYYFVFSLNSEDCSGGPNYLQTSPLSGNTNTAPLAPCVSPASSPSALNLTAANNFISGTFTATSDANRYLVIISTSNSLSVLPVDGTTYTNGQTLGNGTIVSYDPSTTFTASGLTVNTVYYLYVFAANAECTGQPFYNTASLSGAIATTNTSTGIPNGFYNAATGKICQQLKTTLKTITNNGAHVLSYSPGVWNAYQYTDLKPSTNLIWDIYTDDGNPAVPETFNYVYGTNQCGNYNSEGDCYNREHTMPQSWFNGASPMVSDVQHLYPTDGYVNNKRGNFPYGEVTNVTYTSIDNGSKLGTGTNFGYGGTVFEPNNAFKGDLARVYLYMATRYEDEIIGQNWAGNAEANAAMLTASEQPDTAKRRLNIYDSWYLQTIFKWLNQDSVSQKEIDRNNAVYYQSGQSNRNPYIDHPEYAALVWQCSGVVPVTITDFTGTGHKETVALKWYATYETNFKAYEIQRSTDGASFIEIGSVRGQNLANYDFTDVHLPAGSILYYRLKMIDADGRFSYSKIVAVRLNNNFSNAVVYPNPATGNLSVKLTEALSQNSTLTITDVSGRKLQQQAVTEGTLQVSIDVSRLPAGRYFIRINNETQLINQSFIIIR